MDNIPLVLQEYNLSHPHDSTRTQMFQNVSDTKVMSKSLTWQSDI